MSKAMDVRYFPLPDGAGHPESTDLVGRKANFHYASGNVLQQHWISPTEITWRGVSGDFAGVEQTEPTLRVFRVAEDQYYITWYEQGTVATAAQNQVFEDGYPICVFADFGRMIATAAYTNPSEDGGQYFLVDQARIEWVEED